MFMAQNPRVSTEYSSEDMSRVNSTFLKEIFVYFAASGLSCHAWANHHPHALPLTTPQHAGFLFPDQGSDLHPLPGRQSLSHWTAREVPIITF